MALHSGATYLHSEKALTVHSEMALHVRIEMALHGGATNMPIEMRMGVHIASPATR